MQNKIDYGHWFAPRKGPPRALEYFTVPSNAINLKDRYNILVGSLIIIMRQQNHVLCSESKVTRALWKWKTTTVPQILRPETIGKRLFTSTRPEIETGTSKIATPCKPLDHVCRQLGINSGLMKRLVWVRDDPRFFLYMLDPRIICSNKLVERFHKYILKIIIVPGRLNSFKPKYLYVPLMDRVVCMCMCSLMSA